MRRVLPTEDQSPDLLVFEFSSFVSIVSGQALTDKADLFRDFPELAGEKVGWGTGWELMWRARAAHLGGSRACFLLPAEKPEIGGV